MTEGAAASYHAPRLIPNDIREKPGKKATESPETQNPSSEPYFTVKLKLLYIIYIIMRNNEPF